MPPVYWVIMLIMGGVLAGNWAQVTLMRHDIASLLEHRANVIDVTTIPVTSAKKADRLSSD